MVKINESLQLVRYDKVRKPSLSWYSNKTVQWLVNGTKRAYSYDEVKQMYEYQHKHGDLYYIEFRNNHEQFETIGDVWLTDNDFALTISPNFQNKGIGSAVLKYFIDLKRNRGDKEMVIDEVYAHNDGSNALFQKYGFKVLKQKEKGISYIKYL